MRGNRIQNIVKELHEEKIDVIEWSPNHEVFIAKALSPARVSGVYLDDDPDAGRTAVVIVPDDQLSLAIGREGQNARLAAKLTGWRIDIKSVTESVQEALDTIGKPTFKDVRTQNADMLVEVGRVMEKRSLGRAVMPEEFTLLGKFADLVQRKMIAARETARQQRVAEIAAVRSTLPQAAFQMPVTSLQLPDNIIEALQPLGTVGEIMLRYLLDENHLKRMLHDTPGDSLRRLQDALDAIVFPEKTKVEEITAAEPAPVPATPVEAMPDDFDMGRRTKVATKDDVFAAVFDEDEDDLKDKDKKGKKKKSRQLVFDEKTGGMVVKRQRKRGRGDWDEWEE